MSAVDVIVETVIDRPVGVVSAYAGDPTNPPSWYTSDARRLTEER